MVRLAIVVLLALPLAVVVLSAYRFRLEPAWRMDPIPFALFLAAAFFVGRLTSAASPSSGTKGAGASTK